MTDLNASILIITLNRHDLNTSAKRQRLEKWIKKIQHDLSIFFLEETYFKFIDIGRLQVKG